MLLCDQACVEHPSPHKFCSLMRFPSYPLALQALPNLQGLNDDFSSWHNSFWYSCNRKYRKQQNPFRKAYTKDLSWYMQCFLEYTAGCLIRCAGCSRNHHRRCTCSWYRGCHRSRCGAAGGCRNSRQSLCGKSPWHTSRLKHLQMLWHSHIIWQKRPNNSNTMTELWAP